MGQLISDVVLVGVLGFSGSILWAMMGSRISLSIFLSLFILISLLLITLDPSKSLVMSGGSVLFAKSLVELSEWASVIAVPKPCRTCKYKSNDYRLRCAVRPRGPEGNHCSDREEA